MNKWGITCSLIARVMRVQVQLFNKDFCRGKIVNILRTHEQIKVVKKKLLAVRGIRLEKIYTNS